MISEREFTQRNLQAAEASGVEGEMVSPEQWRVPSVTTPGRVYDVLVAYEDGLYFVACSCEAGANRKACKHGLWVLRQIYFFPRMVQLVLQGRRAA